MIVRELFAKLGLDLDEGAFNRATAALSGLRSGLVGVGAVVGAAGVGLAALVKSTAEAGGEVGRTSQRLGIGTEALQEWMHVAEMSGVSTESFEHGVRHLALAASNAASGSAEAVHAFRLLGVQFRDGSGRLRPLESLLGDVNARFAAMPESTQKVALAQHLLGRGGAELLPVLNKNKEAVAELKREAHELGVVLSTETIEDAREFNRASHLATGALRGLGYAIAGPLLKHAGDLSEAFARWVVAHRQWIALKVQAAVDLVRVAAQKLLQLARPWIDLFVQLAANTYVVRGVLIGLAVVLGSMLGNAIGAAVTALGPLITALLALDGATLIAAAGTVLVGLAWLALAALIALVVEDIYGAFHGKDSLLGEPVKKLIAQWEKFRAWLSDAVDHIAAELKAKLIEPADAIVAAWKARFAELRRWFGNLGIGGGLDEQPQKPSVLGSALKGAAGAAVLPTGHFDLFGQGAAGPAASVALGAGAGAGSVQIKSPVTINVNGAGQNAEEIAQAVRQQIEEHHQTTLHEAAAAAGGQ